MRIQKLVQNVSAKIILGIQDAKGKLPASINNDYSVNHHGI
jgi:hypothetical protein